MSFGKAQLDWRQEPARGVPEGRRGETKPKIVGKVMKTNYFKLAGLALKPPPRGKVFRGASLGSFTWLWLKSPQWFGAEKENGFAQFLSRLHQIVPGFHSATTMNADTASAWLIQWENTPCPRLRPKSWSAGLGWAGAVVLHMWWRLPFLQLQSKYCASKAQLSPQFPELICDSREWSWGPPLLVGQL